MLPDAPLIWAELDGGREDLLYVFDGTDDPAEGLATLNSSESNETLLRRYLWLAPLSVQPIGRDPRDPPKPRFLLTDVDVRLQASAGNDAKLTVVETLVPQDRPARALRFDADSIVYAQAGSNLEERFEKVRRVTDESGRVLPFDHRLDELVVALAEPAPVGQPLKLRFEIDGDFLVRPRGDSYWELGIWSWFPVPPLSGQAYTFRSEVRVPEPFVPFAPGKTLRRAKEGTENVLETKIDTPIQFAVILAGRYDMEEIERDGVTIRVATYALDNPRGRKNLMQIASEVISYYAGFLGPFPFSEFNILEINDYGYGQAPPATMFITKEAFDPLAGDMSRYEAQEIAKIFAHEIAHQYWGIVVRIPSQEEQWLAESFAEYCSSLFIRDRRSAAMATKIAKQWRHGAGIADDAAPIPLANRVWITDDARKRAAIRNGLLYDKGPILLADLHKEVGDEAFLAFLRSCQTTLGWKFGTTKEIARLLQAASGRDFMPFFEKYYWGVEMPQGVRGRRPPGARRRPARESRPGRRSQGNTVKFVALVAVPLGVVTAILPLVAPAGTPAVILTELLMVKFAATPLNVTDFVLRKVFPLMITRVPARPEVGEKLVIVGNTLKFVALVAVPPGVVTAILPLVAPEGTVAVILVGLLMVKVAARPLIVTDIALMKVASAR